MLLHASRRAERSSAAHQPAHQPLAVLPPVANCRMISGCGLTGGLPPTWYAPTALGSLSTLDVSNNALAGRLPQNLGAQNSLSSLKILNLSGNNFDGSLPAAWATRFYNLEVIDLAGNPIYGARAGLPCFLLPCAARLALRSRGCRRRAPTISVPCRYGLLHARYAHLKLGHLPCLPTFPPAQAASPPCGAPTPPPGPPPSRQGREAGLAHEAGDIARQRAPVQSRVMRRTLSACAPHDMHVVPTLLSIYASRQVNLCSTLVKGPLPASMDNPNFAL